MTDEPSGPELAAELEDLRVRLAEAEEVLSAIRNGEVDAMVVAGERGQRVYTLSGADRTYRQLIETMSEGAVTLSADGVILYGNVRLAEMLERPLDQVLGSALRNYLPPADQQALDAILAQACTAPSRREINLKTSEGRLVPVYLSASRLQSEGAEMVFCLVLTDLTEQKSHEQIVAAERLARSILEQAAEAIVVCDEQGRVIRASQAAQRFCDGSPLLRPFAEVFPLRTDASDPFQLAPVLQGETLRNVDVALDRQGQKLDLLLNAGPLLRGRQILGCVVTLTDITERKKAEDKLRETLSNLRNALGGIIQVLSAVSEQRDPYTAGHQRRVADLAQAIAQELGLPPDRVEEIRVAGVIHDIGKLSIPAEILSKPTRLSEIEYKMIQSHAQIGHDILGDVKFAWPIANIILQHHERMDGSGYPQRLKGDDILLESRILAVSDVIEAMASHRPYRSALGIEAALKEIENNKGLLYDPAVVSACLTLFREKGYALND